jgi:hypothetical protein
MESMLKQAAGDVGSNWQKSATSQQKTSVAGHTARLGGKACTFALIGGRRRFFLLRALGFLSSHFFPPFFPPFFPELNLLSFPEEAGRKSFPRTEYWTAD